MSIKSYVIKNEELKNLFTYFFGNSVVNAYVSVTADEEFDLKFLKEESKRISQKYKKPIHTMVIHSTYEIVLEFTGLNYVEITTSDEDGQMIFSKYDFGSSIPVTI